MTISTTHQWMDFKRPVSWSLRWKNSEELRLTSGLWESKSASPPNSRSPPVELKEQEHIDILMDVFSMMVITRMCNGFNFHITNSERMLFTGPSQLFGCRLKPDATRYGLRTKPPLPWVKWGPALAIYETWARQTIELAVCSRNTTWKSCYVFWISNATESHQFNSWQHKPHHLWQLVQGTYWEVLQVSKNAMAWPLEDHPKNTKGRPFTCCHWCLMFMVDSRI